MAAGPRLGIVRRWWWLVLLGAALGVGAALIAVRSVAPLYRATSTLFMIPPGEASLNQSFARTYAQMAVHPVVLEQVREILALPTPAGLESMVTARPVTDTQLVEIVALNSDAVVARDIANATAQLFIEQQATLLPVGPAGPALRIGQLAFTPEQPIGPQTAPALLLGVLVGVLVGLGVAALLDMPRSIPAPLEAMPLRQPEPVTVEPSSPPIIRERVGALDVLRGAIVVAVAASALLVPFAAGGTLRDAAEQSDSPPARQVPVATPAAEVAAQPAPQIAAAPAPPPPSEPIPTVTDLPANLQAGGSGASLSPQPAPPPREAEIAGATSAAPAEPPATDVVRAPVEAPAAAPAQSAAAPPSAPSPRTLFEDRFAGGPQLWPSDPQGPARYEASGYRLVAREPGQFVAVAAPFPQPLRDAIVTASFTKVGGPAGGVYGLIVRDSGPPPRDGANQIGNFYVLGVNDRGQYGVWRREGGRWVDLVPLTPSEAIRTGSETNELTARALDDRLSLAVNGVEVATVLGTEPRPGALGVYVSGDLNEVILNRFEVQPATAATAGTPPGPAVAASRASGEAEVAGVVESRQVEARPATTRPPVGFTAAFLREAPATSARALASLPSGTPIEVLSDSTSGDGFTWLRVRTGDGVLGWIVSTAVAG